MKRILLVIDVTNKGGQVTAKKLNGWQSVATRTWSFDPIDLTYHNSRTTTELAKVVAMLKTMKHIIHKAGEKTHDYELVILQNSTKCHKWLTDENQRKETDMSELLKDLSNHFKCIRFEQRKTEQVRAVAKNL